MILTPHELESPLWGKISSQLETRLVQLRRKNDERMPPDDRADILAEIRVIKKLLALGKPDPAVETGDE